MLILEGFINY